VIGNDRAGRLMRSRDHAAGLPLSSRDRRLRVQRVAGLNPDAVQRLWRSFLDGAPGMYWSRVWSVYVFIRWCHRNRVFR
jgi:hypothetical protein